MKQVTYLYDNMKSHIDRMLNDTGDYANEVYNDAFNKCLEIVSFHLENEYKAASVFADAKTREENKELNKTIEEWHYNKLKEIVEGK